MFNKTGRAVSDSTDKSPRSMKDSLIGHRNKIFDSIADHSGEPSRASDQVQASHDPAGPEKRAGNVVPGQTLAQSVVGCYEVLLLERGKVEGGLEIIKFEIVVSC